MERVKDFYIQEGSHSYVLVAVTENGNHYNVIYDCSLKHKPKRNKK